MASSKPEKEVSCNPCTNALAQANNHLAVNMHRMLAEEKSNVFFSPFSISTAMAMLFCASKGETEVEIIKALGYDRADITKNDIASIFEEQMLALLKNPDSYTLDCANSMLSQKGFEIKDQYKSILSDSFKALLLEVDFVKDSEKAVSQINEWVKEKTRNMIPNLVDQLDPSTVMVLMNAVYFKGSWSQKFNETRTSKQNFFNKGFKQKGFLTKMGFLKNKALNDNAVEVDMMYMEEYFPFIENKKFQALELPYAGEKVAMLIILPRFNVSLDSVESSLRPSFVQDLKNSMRKRSVEVYFPRFRLEYSKSLLQCFQRLGIQTLFKRGADLRIASDSPDLAVSDIIHKAVLEVNEEGSEAAAATMDFMKCTSISRSSDPVFRVDHPFVFVIYDTRSDLILFMGRVQEL